MILNLGKLCLIKRMIEIIYKTYKNHTKAQILKLSQEALRFKQNLIVFYGREKERLNAVNSLEALEKFAIKEYLT